MGHIGYTSDYSPQPVAATVTMPPQHLVQQPTPLVPGKQLDFGPGAYLVTSSGVKVTFYLYCLSHHVDFG